MVGWGCFMFFGRCVGRGRFLLPNCRFLPAKLQIDDPIVCPSMSVLLSPNFLSVDDFRQPSIYEDAHLISFRPIERNC